MKRLLGFWVILLITVLAAAMITGCRNDIDVPFPPSLIGDYNGLYRYVQVENGIDTIVDTTQLITFRFSTADYLLTMDESIPEEDRVFCDTEGEYQIENGVNFLQTDSNRTRGVCTFSQNPFGAFGLDQTGNDTVRINQSLVDEAGIRRSKFLSLVLSSQ